VHVNVLLPDQDHLVAMLLAVRPAAITNAINDALKGLGAELLVSPVTPDRIVAAIQAANANPHKP
jgi:hypothetical protein